MFFLIVVMEYRILTTIEIPPLANGRKTNSADIQNALSQVGEGKKYDTAHFIAGSYLIDNSITRKNPHAVIAINSGTTICGDLDADKTPLTFFQLMRNAPTKTFGCGVPIFGPSEVNAHDIKIFNVWFDGQCTTSVGLQNGFKAGDCGGHAGASPNEHGKGFSNFVSLPRCGITNFEMANFKITNTAGDGFRTHEWNKSSGIWIHDGEISMCGHCAIMLENTTNATIENIKVTTRSNGAFRSQKGCSNINVKNMHAIGTRYNYNSGFQVAGNHIKIEKCRIDVMMGCGIEVIGEDNIDIVISECEFLNNGTFALTNNYGVAGVLASGANVIIKDCIFNSNYQNSIAANIYSPDGKRYTKTGYTITTENNTIMDTRLSKFKVIGNGKHIANLLPGHVVTSMGNKFSPEKNYSQNVKFLD